MAGTFIREYEFIKILNISSPSERVLLRDLLMPLWRQSNTNLELFQIELPEDLIKRNMIDWFQQRSTKKNLTV